MITGLNHTNQSSHIQHIGIPKPPSQIVGRNRTLPKPLWIINIFIFIYLLQSLLYKIVIMQCSGRLYGLSHSFHSTLCQLFLQSSVLLILQIYQSCVGDDIHGRPLSIIQVLFYCFQLNARSLKFSLALPPLLFISPSGFSHSLLRFRALPAWVKGTLWSLLFGLVLCFEGCSPYWPSVPLSMKIQDYLDCF